MKLLQWNIWYQEDIKNVVALLRDINPDIICLQELTIGHPEFNKGIDTPKFIAEELGFHFYFKEAHDDPENIFGSGIFSRYPIVKNSFSLIREPKGTYDTHQHFSDQGRVYIECDIDIDGKLITVGTTHMSYTDGFSPDHEKDAEADNLVKILSTKKENYVFAGDLNALPDSYTISEVSKILKNAGPSFEESTWTTKPFNYNGFVADKLKWRLDYCFTTPDVKVDSARIVDTEYSDHLPILIEI